MNVNGRASAAEARALKVRDGANALLASLESVGKEIRSRLDLADKALGKAEDHYKAAGLQLIVARKRIQADGRAGDGAKTFAAFLKQHSIGRSRAYDMIAIAEGTKTLAGIRAKTAERVAAHANRNKDARVSVSNGLAKAPGPEPDRRVALGERQTPGALKIARMAEMQLLISTQGGEEIKKLKAELKKAKESVKDAKGKTTAQEQRAEIANKQRGEALTRAMFLQADVERLTKELEAERANKTVRAVIEPDKDNSVHLPIAATTLAMALSAYDALSPDDRVAFHQARPWPSLRAVAA